MEINERIANMGKVREYKMAKHIWKRTNYKCENVERIDLSQ